MPATPRRSSFAVVRALTRVEGLLGLVQPVLLEERPTEHQLRIPDLVDLVHAIAEQLQRVPRLLLRALHVPGAEVNLGDAIDRMCGLRVVPNLESDANG